MENRLEKFIETSIKVFCVSAWTIGTVLILGAFILSIFGVFGDLTRLLVMTVTAIYGIIVSLVYVTKLGEEDEEFK
jgi:hypothetical protein